MAKPQAASPAIRVLVVDDDPSILESLEAILGSEMKVDTCNTAERALIRLERFTFDVVVADYGLPNMNGVELLQLAVERYRNIGCLLITGSEDNYQVGKQRGHHVLLKPFDPARLCSLVAQLSKLVLMRRTVDAARGSWKKEG